MKVLKLVSALMKIFFQETGKFSFFTKKILISEKDKRLSFSFSNEKFILSYIYIKLYTKLY